MQIFFKIIIINFILFGNFHALAESSLDISDKGFTMYIKNKPIRHVLDEISDRSGYTINCECELLNSPVTIDFRNLTLQEAIRRLFSHFDHAIVYDETNRKITVIVVEGPSPPVSITGKNRPFMQTTKTTQ